MKKTKRLFLLAVVYAMIAGCGGPSDSHLEETFVKNRPAFERLLELKAELDQGDAEANGVGIDSLKTIRTEYRDLRARVGVENLISRTEDPRMGDAVMFTLSTASLRGATKGYLYTRLPTAHLAESLLGTTDSPRYEFKRIAQDWYIYYQRDHR